MLNYIPKEFLIAVHGSVPEDIALVTSDSRKVIPGTIFVAVSGNAADGHGFIQQAIDKGAVAIVHEKEVAVDKRVAFVQVSSSRKVLALLSLAFQGNPQKELAIVGITGTNGKTTISTLLWQMLTQTGLTVGLLGTVRKVYGKTEIQSQLTTSGPEELAADLRRMVEEGCSHVIMEVSSHALDQDRVFGLNFAVAGFTNLTHDHLDYHKTFAEYSRAKKRLFDGLSDTAVSVVNEDDGHGDFMVSSTQSTVWKFGFSEQSEFKILENSTSGLLLDMDGTMISSPLTGRFNAYNVAQAYLMGMALGLSPSTASATLYNAPGAPGRLQKVHREEDDVSVFVDYAHTPDALKNILETLGEVKPANSELIVLFGCGGNRDAAKRPVMAQLSENYADKIVVTSDNPRFEDPVSIINDILGGFSNPEVPLVIEDRALAIEQSILTAKSGAVIVLAGKGHENYQDIKGVKHPMDDAQLAVAALNKRNVNARVN